MNHDNFDSVPLEERLPVRCLIYCLASVVFLFTFSWLVIYDFLEVCSRGENVEI